jgi:cytochrome c peroxidase
MKSQFLGRLFEAKHRAGLLVAAAAVAVFLYMGFGAVAQSAVATTVGSALAKAPQAPKDNPTTQARAALGKLLFWDPLLSGPQDVACASCHHPQNGYAEDRELALGVTAVGLGKARHQSPGSKIPTVKRNSPTVLNIGFNGSDLTGGYDPVTAPMFWDARVKSLEKQALEPLKALEEMRGETYPEDQALAKVVEKLQANAEYRRLFAAAFGGSQPVTAENLGRAIAAFERTLLANNSPFDRYMRGDKSAMTAEQISGMKRFESVGCVRCHSGPMFSDYKLHVMGLPDNPALPASDDGAEKTYAFRTPTLRNLTWTSPYEHNGVFRTLSTVVGFYEDARTGRSRNPNVSPDKLDPLLRQLGDFDEEDVDLVQFLVALSDDSFDKSVPDRVPSGLPVGGKIQ